MKVKHPRQNYLYTIFRINSWYTYDKYDIAVTY
jgi:hypothetical protein